MDRKAMLKQLMRQQDRLKTSAAQLEQESTRPQPAPVQEKKRKHPEPAAAAPRSKLQARFADKLKGAHFRFLNEFLYTHDSQEAISTYSKDPKLFEAYHEGYRMQVNSWPENPLDRMISFCEQFAVRSTSSKVEIGDFGCGEARLAATLQSNSRTRSRVNMHSFDLVAGNEFITACDIRHTPLAAQSLDIAIFCLSLMGTNFQEFLLEAQRVLKIGGHLLIAEVQSRLSDSDAFVDTVVSMGFAVREKDFKNSHFLYFEFVKEREHSQKNSAPSRSEPLLKACKYKKR